MKSSILGIFDYRRKKVKQGRHALLHIDFLGRFEFQKQQNQFNSKEIISVLEQKTAWQKLKTTDETLDQKPYFTFLRG